eukprot:NODE_7291_length_777_cov_87.749235_g7050_i0.p1 GENE.NODE_7291_length_777_cov_87.749235_g7050_i0~~NODE_7291_length_777_cov_87.749235_g7050_i0.p1  ORF type:complete len:200 (+),score=53.46 NODE_7291_length_777_cov_87.749235_g7050_i0:58-600(+)
MPKTAEMYLFDLDDFMMSYKRFQTRGDWEIELQTRRQRMISYFAAIAAYVAGRSMVMSDADLLAKTDPYVVSERGTARGKWWRSGWIHKQDIKFMTPQGLHARWYQFLLGVKRFPVRHGAAQWACGAIPAFLTFAAWNHYTHYMKQNTVFGEVARELVCGTSETEIYKKVIPLMGLEKKE